MLGTVTTALVAFLLSPIPFGVRGSLVVAIVSQKGDYVVVAAESRSLDLSRRRVNNLSCKIIGLGGEMLFFETGVNVIGVQRGEAWNAEDVARAIYQESQNRDARTLSIAWGNRALQWFYSQSSADLQSTAETNGGIVTGGFIGFDNDGKASVQNQTIYYSTVDRTLSRRPTGQPPIPGQVVASGIAKELAAEFFEGKTKRAIEAFGPIGTFRLIGVDAGIDANLARKAIEFAIRSATGREQEALGGPIDIAVLRRNRTIEWVNRKPECFKMDQRLIMKKRSYK